MRAEAGNFYAAELTQPLGIAEGYAGNTGAVPAGIYPQYHAARLVIAVVFTVKLFHHRHDGGVIPERIQQADVLRQRAREFESEVECYYLFCNCHTARITIQIANIKYQRTKKAKGKSDPASGISLRSKRQKDDLTLTP